MTYATFVLDYRPLKTKPYCVRITVGGNKLSYPFDSGSPAANLLETKLLFNSTLSDADKGDRFMSAGIKDYFLATPMDRDEYMMVKLKYFPNNIITQYQLLDKVSSNSHVYIRIKKGMYGLKQAAPSLKPLETQLSFLWLLSCNLNSGPFGTPNKTDQALCLC